MKLLVALVTLLHVSQHALGVEVEVTEGAESVLLPCQVTVTSQFNAVSWIVERLSDKKVHVRGRSGDKLEDQNQDYRGRTSMRTDSLMTGDLSLTLKNPTFTDIETYTCIYREEGLEKSRQEVHLKVKAAPPPPPVSVIAVSVLGGVLLGAAGRFIGFEWKERKDQQVEEGAESVQLSFNTTGHLSKTGDTGLTLRRLRDRDRGLYSCSVYNKDRDWLRETE